MNSLNASDIASQSIAIFLALYFTSIAAFYTFRLTLSGRRGKLVFPGPVGSRHWLAHLSFKVFRALILAVCVLRLFVPQVDTFLILIPFLQWWPLNVSGCVLLLSGFAIALIGHRTLGSNWRSGIDPAGPQALVTNHIYRLSRNPMFVGVITAQLGFFFALPSVFSSLCLAVGALAIASQVKLEEAHLEAKWGQHYMDYLARTPRWI